MPYFRRKYRDLLTGIEKAQCVLKGMKSGNSKAKARKSCGVKAKR
jgi:hypothetical protein